LYGQRGEKVSVCATGMRTGGAETNPQNPLGDRGPFDRRRSLDISHAVAKQLGFEKCGVLRLDTRVEEQAAR